MAPEPDIEAAVRPLLLLLAEHPNNYKGKGVHYMYGVAREKRRGEERDRKKETGRREGGGKR